MSQAAKIWLWIALVLCIGTTIINATSGRIPSVILAIGGIVGLAILLFAQKKIGFYILCGFYAISLFVGIFEGVTSGTDVVMSIVMSVIGSLLVPGITYLVLRKQFSSLK